MVAGDGNSDLVGSRGDIQVAVHHNNLDVAVVIGGDHEVVLGQAHLVAAHIRTLRNCVGAIGQHHADCLCSHVGREAGHALLTGVVDLAVVVTGDRYGDLGSRRNHRQSAIRIFDSIIAGCSLDKGVGGNLIRHRAFARVGDGTCDCCADLIIAHKSVHAVRRIAVRLSIIFELFALCGNRHRFGVDFQGAVVPRNRISRTDVLSSVGDRQAGDGIRNGAFGHIGHAAGDLHRQNVAVREGINTVCADRNRSIIANLEGIAVLAVGVAVVGPALIVGRHGDGLRRTIGHGQLSIRIADSVVVCAARSKGMAGNLVLDGALARVGDAARNRRGNRVAADKAGHRIVGVAVRTAVIGEIVVRGFDCHRLRVNLQGSVAACDRISPTDIHGTVGDGQAGNGVCNRTLGHIGHAAGDLHRQDIAVFEGINAVRADRNRGAIANLEGIAVLAVGVAVIGPALAAGRHGDLHRIRIAHRQGAVLSGNTVVSSSTRRKLVALQDIIHRALARIGDAALNHCADRIGAYQPFRRIAGVAVRLAIVLKGFAGRDDPHCLRVDLQGSVVSGDGVSPADILALIGDGQTGNGIRNLSLGHIGDAAFHDNRQNVAVREGINASRADRLRLTVADFDGIAVLSVGVAVVGPAAVVSGHSDGLRLTIGHGQLPIRIADSVVVGSACGKGMAGDLVLDRTLARVGDAARNRCGNLVAANKAGHRIAGVAVRTAVIGKGFGRSGDCHRFFGNLKLAIDCRDLIFAGHSRRAALNGVARHGIGALARVGLAAGNHYRQNIAVFEGMNAVRADLNRSAAVNGQLITIRRQSGAVIGPGAAVRRNDENGLCLPDGIEVVFALVIKANLRANSIFRLSVAFGSAPAKELIIGLRLGKAAAFQRKHRMLIVVAEAAHHIRIGGRAVRIIRMIADRNRHRSVAPLCIEGDILGSDVKLILGIIGVAAAVGLGIPAQEDLVRRCGHAGGSHDFGIAVLRITLGVRRRAAAAVRIIRNGKGRRADIVGIKSDVAVNPGIKVKGRVGVMPFGAGAEGPADPLGPGGDLFVLQSAFINGAAVRNFDDIGSAAARHRHMDGAGKGRGSPFGIDDNIVGGHRPGKDIGIACKHLIVIPALEHIGFRHAGRTGRCIADAADVGLILLCLAVRYIAAVAEVDAVVVAVVVEGDGVIIRTIVCERRTIRQIIGIGKAGDGIMVLSRRTPSGIVTLE